MPHPADGPVVPQPVTGPVVPQPVTGPVVPQPVTGPVVPQPVTGPVVPQPVPGPVVTQPVTGPVVPQPVTGLVVPQPVTGPVVPHPADGPVDVPTINIRVVSPLPKVTSSVRRKTSRSGKTCIITSSPYKRNLELEKTKGPSSKEVKKQRTKESEPPSKKSKKIRSTTEEHGPTPSTSGTAPTSAQRKNSNTNAECLYCNDKFSDSLPGEIWIQCSQCKELAHQDCSGHEVGDFECEMCA